MGHFMGIWYLSHQAADAPLPIELLSKRQSVLSLRLNTPPTVAAALVAPEIDTSTWVVSTASRPEPLKDQAALADVALPKKAQIHEQSHATESKTQPDKKGEAEPTVASLKGTPIKIPLSAALNYQVLGQRRGVPWSAGVGTLNWTHHGEAYSLALVSPHYSGKTRTQTSRGQLSLEAGLLPTRFGDRLTSEQATHFQRTETGEWIRFSSNRPAVELAAYAQDQLSVLIQLAAIMSGRADAGLSIDTALRLQVATARDAAVWTFVASALADDGDIVYIKKEPSHLYDGRWEVWLSAKHGYLPVRWRVSLHSGDFYEYQLHPVD